MIAFSGAAFGQGAAHARLVQDVVDFFGPTDFRQNGEVGERVYR
jgi:hypothetical protein